MIPNPTLNLTQNNLQVELGTLFFFHLVAKYYVTKEIVIFLVGCVKPYDPASFLG